MRIGIVGSRNFSSLEMINQLILSLPRDTVVISGGATGVDAAAALYAKEFDHEVIEHRPDLTNCKLEWQFTKAYHARNQKIVDDSDIIFAFTDKDAGGTWYTIKRARVARKPVRIIRSTDTPNYSYLLQIDDLTAFQQSKIAPKSRELGPYHIKRAGIGTFAIHISRHFSKETIKGLISEKSECPEKLARRICSDFETFLARDGGFGHIDWLTMPPRSIRNIDKPHVMEIVVTSLADIIGVPAIRVFKPWNKTSRGSHSEPPKISVDPAIVDRISKKVILVCDDFTTTNQTIGAAVRSLKIYNAHPHGLIWMSF
jgi:hypothetical protein